MKLLTLALTTLFCASAALAQEASPEASASPVVKKTMTPEEQIKRYDKDGDGSVTLEEYSAKSKESEKEKAKAKFERRDKNKDGKLTVEELTPKEKASKEGASEKESE